MNQNKFDQLYKEIAENKIAFLGVFFAVVLLSYAVLVIVDFIPEPVKTVQTQKEAETKEVIEEIPAIVEEAPVSPLPLKIKFDSLNREVVVHNPESRDVADLDTALLSGAVRHPDSADFTQKGNIFILGHSSYLPTVFNKNFQAFNGIQELTWGDTIRLESEDTEYIYRVQKVYKAKAGEVVVPYTPGEAKLTLATCNSFGSKDDRFIVEADLIETKKL